MLAAEDVIAFEQNGDTLGQSGGRESCPREFADGQHSLTVPWLGSRQACSVEACLLELLGGH